MIIVATGGIGANPISDKMNEEYFNREGLEKIVSAPTILTGSTVGYNLLKNYCNKVYDYTLKSLTENYANLDEQVGFVYNNPITDFITKDCYPVSSNDVFESLALTASNVLPVSIGYVSSLSDCLIPFECKRLKFYHTCLSFSVNLMSALTLVSLNGLSGCYASILGMIGVSIGSYLTGKYLKNKVKK